MKRTVTTDELKTMLEESKDITLLDVRRATDREADKEALPGAQWLDPEKVNEWGEHLPKDKNVVIYCARGGSISNKVLDQLLEKNIQARYLEGGIAAWKAAGGTPEKNKS